MAVNTVGTERIAVFDLQGFLEVCISVMRSPGACWRVNLESLGLVELKYRCDLI